MNRRAVLRGLAGFALCPLCAAEGFGADAPHWTYQDAVSWGGACGLGDQQSPVDISATVKAQIPPLQIKWTKRTDTIVNNGHTIELNVAADAGSMLTIGSDKYTLQRFHFHRPSEHLIGGKSFAMEAHFVHRSDAGAAVIGVMMQPGKSNPAFAKIVATMPTAEGPPVKSDPGVDPNALLPAKRNYVTYEGSLTTPPRAEVVNWNVLTEPIEVAAADIASFAKLYPMNARPPQKLNRRFVLRPS
jgi:carbonic anhydrase